MPVTAAPVLVVLGDSLSAGYGLSTGQGWVALLEKRLKSEGYPHQVVNASISGDTTGGGLVRLPDLLRAYRPVLVVIELGANDGLRGIPLPTIEANLARMVAAIESTAAETLVVRMRLPPNYGPAYTAGFDAIYDKLEDPRHRVSLAPFFLAEVILEPKLMQSDGLHPNATAQPRLLDAVWPSLKPRLARPLAVSQP